MNELNKVANEIVVEEIKKILDGDFDKLTQCIQELNSWNGCLDWLEFYENDDDFFEMFFGDRSLDMLHAMKYGDFDFDDEYVKFNGYDNLDSYSYREVKEEVEDNLDEIVENLIENKDSIDIRWIDTEIADLLDELDEEDEEE